METSPRTADAGPAIALLASLALSFGAIAVIEGGAAPGAALMVACATAFVWCALLGSGRAWRAVGVLCAMGAAVPFAVWVATNLGDVQPSLKPMVVAIWTAGFLMVAACLACGAGWVGARWAAWR